MNLNSFDSRSSINLEACSDDSQGIFKQTEIGNIPLDWNVEYFESLTDAITCGVAATPKYVSAEVGMPFLSAQNVKEGQVSYVGHKYITKQLFEQITRHNKPQKGDILYTRVGAGIGEAAVIPDDYSFAVYVSLTLIKPKVQKLNSHFICHILNSTRYRFLAKNGQFAGGGVQNLNVEVVRKFPIPVPPIKEQIAIANALSDVDALIQELEKLIAKKQAIKTATMQQLLTGRTRLPQFGHHPDGRQKGYKPSELGEIPEDWEVLGFGSLFQSTVTKKSVKQNCLVTFVGMQDVTEQAQLVGQHFVSVEKVKSGFTYFERGDVLVAKITPCFENGKGCHTESLQTEIGFGSTEFHVLRTTDNADSKFVYYWTTRNIFRNDLESEMVGSAGHRRVPLAAIANYQIPVPPKLEQTAIATILSDMDGEIQSLEQRFNKTSLIKQGMMQELLTGKTRLIKGEAND